MTSRDPFLLDPDVVYLNHGAFGACPRPVFDTYQQWQREMRQQFAAQAQAGGPQVRMIRGNSTFVAPGPSGGVAFAVTTDNASSDPTEKPANPK